MSPPYGRQIGRWIQKAYQAALAGATLVCLVPARTDTKWFRDFCAKGKVPPHKTTFGMGQDVCAMAQEPNPSNLIRRAE